MLSRILIFSGPNYIPEKCKFSGILCFCQQLRRVTMSFIVSAITFEEFKLHSSNLTHALLIQISRTSSISDIVVPSKMAAGGHFVNKKKIPYRSKMARNVIDSSYFVKN